MKVTIFGSGYVGLVTGACLAQVGNDVLCIDIDEEKIARLKRGEIPIYEPGLEDMVVFNHRAGRLQFSSDPADGVAHGPFQMIAVGTPPDEDGSADLKHVLAVAESIGRHMDDYRIIVTKSTVPVGTADKVRNAVSAAQRARGSNCAFDVVSNPEFLKEGAAIEDFMKPDRIVVGADSDAAADRMRMLYAPFNRSRERILVMDVKSAELTKYAANSMLATKISFMNELANLAEALGADIEQVRIGIGADPRIGYHFIYPGCGFGGSCFPKDVKALIRTASEMNMPAQLLEAVEDVNQRQKTRLFSKINAYFNGNLKGKTIALWGLSFKPNTDDMREASSRVLMEALWEAGASVQAHDPIAMEETQHIYGERADLKLCAEPMDALTNADALAVVTEWSLFRSPDFNALKRHLKEPVIFDGRNLYNPAQMKKLGFRYFAIGRGESCAQ